MNDRPRMATGQVLRRVPHDPRADQGRFAHIPQESSQTAGLPFPVRDASHHASRTVFGSRDVGMAQPEAGLILPAIEGFSALI